MKNFHAFLLFAYIGEKKMLHKRAINKSSRTVICKCVYRKWCPLWCWSLPVDCWINEFGIKAVCFTLAILFSSSRALNHYGTESLQEEKVIYSRVRMGCFI